MRDIATSAARDAHLGKKLRAALKERHLAIGVRARTSDRSEESRRAAACDNDFFMVHKPMFPQTLNNYVSVVYTSLLLSEYVLRLNMRA